MNKIDLNRFMAKAVFGISAVMLPFSATSAENVNDSTNDECSQEILLSYFPGVFVTETLKKFNVPKDQWEDIKQKLLARDKEVIKQVQAKASKMDPNPLKDPEQRQTAVKLFRETLFENFASVMKAHGVKDDKQIQAMLDDIQQQKAKRFARCMELRKNQQGGNPAALQPSGSAQKGNNPTSMNNDNDDDSDDADNDGDDN